jgi:hypothetical protein
MKNITGLFNLRGAVPPSPKIWATYLGIVMGALGLAMTASAEDITIHLPRNASVARKTVQYRCDAQATKVRPAVGFVPRGVHQRRREQPGRGSHQRKPARLFERDLGFRRALCTRSNSSGGMQRE